MLREFPNKKYFDSSIKDVFSIIDFIASKAYRLAIVFSILLVFVDLLVILLQVVCRYVFHSALLWPEAAARYLGIWLTFMGSSAVLYRQEHVVVSFLQDMLPSRMRYYLLVFLHSLLFIVLIVLLIYGIDISIRSVSHRDPALFISMIYPRLAVPVGSLFMLVINLNILMKNIQLLMMSKVGGKTC